MAQLETKMDVEEGANGETIPFRVELPNLIGIDPLTVEFGAESSIKEMTAMLTEQLKLDQPLRLQTAMPFDSVPPCFDIKVGDSDRIDFDENTFTISKDTRFVEYWNDFLEAANRLDEEKDTDQTEGEVQYDGKLKALLRGTTLTIGDARIAFQRTVQCQI